MEACPVDWMPMQPVGLHVKYFRVESLFGLLALSLTGPRCGVQSSSTLLGSSNLSPDRVRMIRLVFGNLH